MGVSARTISKECCAIEVVSRQGHRCRYAAAHSSMSKCTETKVGAKGHSSCRRRCSTPQATTGSRRDPIPAMELIL
jgi:hypothetical protein